MLVVRYITARFPAFPVNTLIMYYSVAWDNENNLVALNVTWTI